MDLMALMATLSLDKSKYEQGLQDAEGDVKSSGGKIGKALATLGKIGATAIGASATAVGVLAKQSISAYANYEQLEGGVKKLFGDSADQIMAYAENAYKTAGMSANQYMEQATSFSASLINSLDGDTARAAELTDVAMRAISDNFNTFGGDISMVQGAFQGFAKQNYTMLDNLKLGYGGTKSEMERLISDANEYAESIGQASNLSIDSFADIVQAIELVQEKQHIAGTTAKEASTTIEGSLLMTKSAWENLVAGLANGNADVSALMTQFLDSVKTTAGNVLPVAKQALSGIGTAVEELAPEIINAIPTLIEEVVPELFSSAVSLVTTVGQALMSALPSLWKIGQDMVKNISSGIAQGIPNVLSTVLPIAKDLSAKIRENAGNIVDAGIDLVMNLADGLVAGIPDMVENVPIIIDNLVNIINDNVPKLLVAGFNVIKTLALGIWDNRDVIMDNIGNIATMVIDTLQAINWMSVGKNVITMIGNGVKGLISFIPNLMKNIGQNAGNAIRNINWATVGTSIINLLSQGIRGLASSIPNILRGIGQTAMGVLRNISWSSVGSSIISGIVAGLRAAGSAITNYLLSLGRDALKSIKNLFKIGSPSKVFRDEVGQWIPEGIALGIKLNEDSVKHAMEDMADLTMDSYNPNLVTATPDGTGIYGGNNITVQVYGAENPEEFADRFVRRLKLDMRTA